MTERADAVVVGAGVIGASIAYHLAAAGLSVTVISTHEPASGATGSSAGIVRAFHPDPALVRLALASLSEFLKWNENVGGSIGFVHTGCLHLSEDDEPDLQKRVAVLQEMGVACEILRSEELRTTHSHIDWPEETLAIWEPDAGYADPRRCTRKYLEAVVEKGGRVHTGSTVVGLTARNGRLAGLRTSTGLVSTDTAVLATGGWAVHLAPILGTSLPVRTKCVTGQRLSVAPPTAGLPVFIEEGSYPLWFRPDGEGRLMLGGSMGDWDQDPAQPVRGPDKSSLQAARDRLQERLSSQCEFQVLEVRSGLDAFTADGLPIIDRGSFVAGLHLAVGFSGGGFKVAPAVGRLVAQWVTSGKKDELLAPFALRRLDQLSWAESPSHPLPLATKNGSEDRNLAEAGTPNPTPGAESAKPSPLADDGGREDSVPAPVASDPPHADAPSKPKRRRRRKRSSAGQAPIELREPQTSFPHAALQIRQATEKDLEQLPRLVLDYVDFYRRPHPDPKALDTLLWHLQMNPAVGRQFVAIDGGQLVGFATLYFTFSTLRAQKAAVLNDLFVKPECRRRGIAQALFEACLAFVGENGYAYMEWVTAPDNKPARTFYEKMGAHVDSWVVYSI